MYFVSVGKRGSVSITDGSAGVGGPFQTPVTRNARVHFKHGLSSRCSCTEILTSSLRIFKIDLF